MTEMTKTESGYALLPKTVNGAIAGICGLICVFPLDLVKTRLQKQQIGPDGKKMYNNMLDAFSKTYKIEGLSGMYRGMFVTMILVTPEKAIKLAANDFFRYHFGEKYGHLALHRQVLAGALTGLSQGIITTPMELLKIQMQDSGRVAAQAKLGGKTINKITSTELILGIFRKYGFFGIYKGIGPTLMRDVWFSLLYFPLFATLNEKGPKRADRSGEAVWWWSFMSGFISGAISAVTVTPFDVVKTRIQTIVKAESDRTFTGIRETFMYILQYEGPAALFKGGICRVIVIAPLLGITQAVYYLGVAEYLLGYEK